jgi:endonuclease/exonuclease/phosphatase family metal-dependent hydrolase
LDVLAGLPASPRVRLQCQSDDTGIPAAARDVSRRRADAVAAGTAKGRTDGITHKSSRIDYVFFDPGSSLQLVSMENVETSALIGIEASDHGPQVATFTLK